MCEMGGKVSYLKLDVAGNVQRREVVTISQTSSAINRSAFFLDLDSMTQRTVHWTEIVISL